MGAAASDAREEVPVLSEGADQASPAGENFPSSPDLSRRIALLRQKSVPHPPVIKRLSAASLPVGKALPIPVQDIEIYLGRSGIALERDIEKIAPLCVEVTNLSRKEQNTFYSVLRDAPGLEKYVLLNERIESKQGLSHHIFVFSQAKKEFCGCILLKGAGKETLKNQGIYELKYAKNPHYKIVWGMVVKQILDYFNFDGAFLNYYAHVTPYDNYPSYRAASSIMTPMCRIGGDYLDFTSHELYKASPPSLRLGTWLASELKRLSTCVDCRRGSPEYDRFVLLIERAKKFCENKKSDMGGRDSLESGDVSGRDAAF